MREITLKMVALLILLVEVLCVVAVMVKWW